MTTTVLAPYLTQQFFTNIGAPLAGGLLYSYQAGTVTPTATYTDNTGVTPNSNPIVLNSRGECTVWVLPNVSYKFVLTDATGNTIWTRDQVINAQLLTLFGGVDSGFANNYILNFAWSNTAYANGEVVYWIPSNNNTGPSTLNINGLGPIPIVNIDGSALGANQIVANRTAQTMFYNGQWQLISVGNFTGVTVGTFGNEIALPSAATTNLGSAPAHMVLITGTTTITSFGSSANISAPLYHVRFSGSLTLTFNAISMQLPANSNLVTQAGDACLAEYLGNGNWKVTIYQSNTGGSVGNAKIKPSDTAVTSLTALTPDPDLQSNVLGIGRYAYELYLLFDSVAAGAGFKFTNDGSAVDSRGLSPALAQGFINAAAYGNKSETFYGATVSYAAVSTAANSNQVIYKGSLLVSTPGTFGISWAQVVSTASATTLRAGSYLTLTLLTTGSSASIVLHVYVTPGSFTETIPIGYSTVTIEAWGGTGFGGSGTVFSGTNVGGGGGGSGGYALSNYSVLGLGGQTINFVVGAAANLSSVSSGTFSLTTMTANTGGAGGNASPAPGIGGTGGTATGGNASNLTGNAGTGGSSGGVGAGGAGGPGLPGLNGGGNPGGVGATALGAPGSGNPGVVIFKYAP